MVKMPFHELINPIQNCLELLHKPKIIVVQACRGYYNISQTERIEYSMDSVMDPVGERYYNGGKDTIIIYASVPGTPALKPKSNPSKPSRLIELISKYLGTYGESHDFQTITEMVCKEMTEDEVNVDMGPRRSKRFKKCALCPSTEITLTKKIAFFPNVISPQMNFNAINVPHLGISIGTQHEKKLSSDIMDMSAKQLNKGWPITICLKTFWASEKRHTGYAKLLSQSFESYNNYSEKILFDHGVISIGMTDRIYNDSQKESRFYLNVKPNAGVNGLCCRWTETIVSIQSSKCLHHDEYTHNFANNFGHLTVLETHITENEEIDIRVEIFVVTPTFV